MVSSTQRERRVIKILFIIPYLDLKQTFEQALASFDLSDIQVSMTHIFGSDPKTIDSLDADIIVARGITASAIATQKSTIHTVPISLSSADLLDALAKAKRLDPCAHIGIISNEYLSDEEAVESLIGQRVTIFHAIDQHDVAAGVELLRRQGCTIFVGGLTMCRLCEEQGLVFVHVKTGTQAVVHAVGEAVGAARSLRRAQMRTTLLSALLNNATYALLAIDTNGIIISGNKKAEQIFSKQPLEGLSVEKVYYSSRWHEAAESEQVVTINAQSYLVSREPIDMGERSTGFLYTFQDTEAISKSEHKIRTELQGKGLVARYSFSDIVTEDSRMLTLVEKAQRFAQVAGTVLLLGETGTGKELFAQSIHNASQRATEPFVAINCAALPEHLLESELFGYTDGAFTGAVKGGKAGLFELAHKGTLFLDEIVEMPFTVQAKLLRVLQEREVRKIGADMVIPVDVRIIAAANSTIVERVREGAFRLDLFYRISLLTLTLIPLRDRKGDLGILFRHFVSQYCSRHSIPKPTITDEAIEALYDFPWPGNIRELRNAAERLAILHTRDVVKARDMDALDIGSTSLHITTEPAASKPMRTTVSDEELYEQFITSGLSRELFAKQVGISRTTLWRKFARLGE